MIVAGTTVAARSLPTAVRRARPRANPALAIGSGLGMTAALWIAAGRAPAAAFWMIWLLGLLVFYGFRDRESALNVFAFGFPFEFVFYGWGVGRYNMLAYPAIGLALLWSLSRRGPGLRLRAAEMAYAVLLAWSAVTLLWAVDPIRGVGILFTHFGLLAVLFMFSRGVNGVDGVLRCLWWLVAGVLMLGVALLPYYERTAFMEMYGNVYLSTFGSADEVSQYDFGNAALVAFVAALGLWEFERTSTRRLAAMAAAGVLATAIFLTLGRSLAVELGVCALAWATVSSARFPRALKLVLVSLAVGGGLLAALTINRAALETRWGLTRLFFEEGNVIGLTSGRSTIWEVSLDMFDDHPVGGIGLGQFQQAYVEYGPTGLPKGAHNAFLMFLTETGVVGAVLLTAFFVALGGVAWQARGWRHVTMAWWLYFPLEANLHGFGRNKAMWLVAGLTIVLSRMQEPVLNTAARLATMHSSRLWPARNTLRKMPGPRAAPWDLGSVRDFRGKD